MKNTISWNTGISHCKDYFDVHGDLRCGATYVCDDGFRLGSWLARQRCLHNKNKLSADKVKILEDLKGLDRREVNDIDLFCSHLKCYYEKFNSCLVPDTYMCSEDEYRLGYYDAYFRRCKAGLSNRRLLPEEIEALNDVGYIWDKHEYVWQIGYRHAEQFWKQNNHLLVLQDYHCEDDYNLGSWIRRQRMLFRSDPTTYPKERYEALCKIGMLWNRDDIWWMHTFNNAQDLYQTKKRLVTRGMRQQYAKKNLDVWISLTKKWLNESDNILPTYHLLQVYAEKLNKMFEEVQ